MAASCRDLQLRSTIQGCQHKLLSSFFLICRAVALLELEEKKKKILARNDAGISVRWIQLMVIVYLLHNI